MIKTRGDQVVDVSGHFMLMSLSIYDPTFHTEAIFPLSPSWNGSRSNVYSRVAIMHQMNSENDESATSRSLFELMTGFKKCTG